MAQILGGDVVEHVLAPGVVVAQGLGEVAHGRGQLALRAAELLEHQRGQVRVGTGDAYGVHQALVVDEHGGNSPWDLAGGAGWRRQRLAVTPSVVSRARKARITDSWCCSSQSAIASSSCRICAHTAATSSRPASRAATTSAR